jgi:hypothetical protein
MRASTAPCKFYSPRSVTKKVWEIVDKYIPGVKSVLEPSAGIGRFAEDHPNHKFTLNEYDETSSRISGILHFPQRLPACLSAAGCQRAKRELLSAWE